MSRRHSTLISRLPILAVGIFLLLGALVLLPGQSAPHAKADSNIFSVTGFVWHAIHDPSGINKDGGLGWISFNCNNEGVGGCVSSNYHVDFNTDSSSFSGYAWSGTSNTIPGFGTQGSIGWLRFDAAGPYPAAPDHSAKLNPANNYLTGWVRACVYATSPATCSGGRDGWILLSQNTATPTWGVKANLNSGGGGYQSTGLAWGGDELGWVSFGGSINGTVTDKCDPQKQVCWGGGGDTTVTLTVGPDDGSGSITGSETDNTTDSTLDRISNNDFGGIASSSVSITGPVLLKWSSTGFESGGCSLIDVSNGYTTIGTGLNNDVGISRTINSNHSYAIACTKDKPPLVSSPLAIAELNLKAGAKLTVVINGGGSVTSTDGNIVCPPSVTKNCQFNYTGNETVTLNHTDGADPFTGWDKDCSGSSGCTVSMTTDRTVIANFGDGGKDFTFEIGGKALGDGITYVSEPADGPICSVPIKIGVNLGSKVNSVIVRLDSGLPPTPVGFGTAVAHFTSTNDLTDCTSGFDKQGLNGLNANLDQNNKIVYFRIYFPDRGTNNNKEPSPYSSKTDYILKLHGVADTGKTADSSPGPWLRYKDSRAAETGVNAPAH